MHRLNCTVPGAARLECLRGLPAAQLLQASIDTNAFMHSPIGTAYGPVMDGTFINRQHFESLELGLFRKVPLLITNMRDEGMFFVGSEIVSALMTPYEFIHRTVPFMNQSEFSELHSLYKEDSSGLRNHNDSDVLSDYYFKCPSRAIATAYAKEGLPVIKSFFSHVIGASYIPLLNMIFKSDLGASHGTDLPFWWQFQSIMIPFGQERALSRVMLRGLMDFGSCPDLRNCRISGIEGSRVWPLYEQGRINLKTPVTQIFYEADTEIDQRCEFFGRVITEKYQSGPFPGQEPPLKH